MINAFHSAGLGLEACQEQLAARGQNIANVDTVGYKAQGLDFSDTLYSAYRLSGGGELAMGMGARSAGIVSATESGAPESTGRTLDFMIDGDGYFCVQRADGGLCYTRAGNFSSSADGWLVTSAGNYVLDGNLQRIQVISGKEGSLSGPSGIGAFTFVNSCGLTRNGENLLEAGAASGPAVYTRDAEIRQGYLERSSVDLVTEMAQMIRAQRGFQVNARMIQSADEIEETVNQLHA